MQCTRAPTGAGYVGIVLMKKRKRRETRISSSNSVSDCSSRALADSGLQHVTLCTLRHHDWLVSPSRERDLLS